MATAILERWPLRRLEAALVGLIAAHTLAVGCGLFFVPEWALRFGGWESLPDPFFPRQAGIFHFILAAGYMAEYLRHRTVFLMVMAKSLALVFLLGMAAVMPMPWFVPLAGLADGLMAASIALVHRRAQHHPG